MVEFLASVLVGLAMFGLVRLLVRPDARLVDRLAPYSQLQALRFGRRPDVMAAIDTEAASISPARWAERTYSRMSLRLSEVLDVDGGEGIRLLLRRAGERDMTVEVFRRQQLQSTVVGGIGGALVAIVLGAGAVTIVLLAGFGAAFGGVWFRRRLTKQAERRSELMKLELYTVAQLLSMLVRANHGPVGAVRAITERATSATTDELNLVLGWIEAGTAPAVAFHRLAAEAADPSAARLFRLIGNATTSGGDMATSLQSFATQLRHEQREQLEKSATQRRAAMLVPIVFFSTPIAMLYVAAPIPSVLQGVFQ